MPSTNNHPTYFTRRANNRVANMAYSSEVEISGVNRAELGAVPTAGTNNIINATSIATALVRGGTLVPAYVNNPDSVMGAYGRNVVLALSGAGTPTVTVYGRDYLGQGMSENLVATGATPVVGKKAFKFVDSVTCAAVGATTLNLGGGLVLGLPYSTTKVDAEFMDGVLATAGTFVPGVATQTATSGDPRGTIVTNTVPNGVREFVVICHTLNGQLHGVAQFAA
jgi:hypothetical protein